MILDKTSDRFYQDVIGWSHQCWQLYKLGKDISLDEFKTRMDIDNIDYHQFMIDYADRLNQSPDTDLIYIQRVIDVLDND